MNFFYEGKKLKLKPHDNNRLDDPSLGLLLTVAVPCFLLLLVVAGSFFLLLLAVALADACLLVLLAVNRVLLLTFACCYWFLFF